MSSALRTALFSIASLLCIAPAACGGKGKGAAPPADPAGDPAADGAGAEYCEGYRGCAEERARMDDLEGKSDDELSPEERTALAEAIEGRVAGCRETYAGLTLSQQQWLESCTGCGGSCDVYDCLDQASAIADGVTFECDLGYDEPPPEDGDGGEE